MARADFHPDQRSIFRKLLGGVKQSLLNKVRYDKAARKAQHTRRKQEKYLDQLSPIETAQSPDFEIHMLCCHRDIDMGMWASWSMMRFVQDKAKLFVHSDGSLSDEDIERWKRVIPGMEVTTKDQRDRKVAEMLEGSCPTVYDWRCKNWASSQLVDMQFFGTTDSILLMDSDVLTFFPPIEVIDTLAAEPKRFAWCRDLINAYSAPAATLKEVTGKTVVNKLCAGYLVSPRLSLKDYQSLEGDLLRIRNDDRIDVNHFWSCQTYYALIACNYPESRELTTVYANTMSSTKSTQPMRHYVGIPSVRFRYFEEGLPTIIKQLGL